MRIILNALLYASVICFVSSSMYSQHYSNSVVVSDACDDVDIVITVWDKTIDRPIKKKYKN